MARYTEALCRVCRREGLKMFLKGERCFTEKCAVDRRAYAPGQHGQRRGRKASDYALQLREKQKVKRMYGVYERQFRRYFELAETMKGVTGENLIQVLERRLDNVVYRLGFSCSRNEARQLVRHSHFTVNGRKVQMPSQILKPGDVVEVRGKSRAMERIKESLAAVERRGPMPSWLDLDSGGFRGTVKGLPAREDVTMPIQESLIVELYSR